MNGGETKKTSRGKPVSWASIRGKLDSDPERVAAARSAAEAEVLAYQLMALRKDAALAQSELSKTMGVSQR